MQGFSDLGVDEWLVRQLGALAITNPTPIQNLAIPPLIQCQQQEEDTDTTIKKKNVVGIAETGGGKTAAFALPILQHLARDIYGVFALVVTASRELGYQLADQFVALGSPIGIRVTIVIGGTSHEKQLESLEKARPHIVVATPGRLAMLMRSFPEQVQPSVRNVKYIVLDEADRLLEDEMRDDTLDSVRFVVGARRNKKVKPQMLMFTATSSPRLQFPEGEVWEAAGFVKRKKKQQQPENDDDEKEEEEPAAEQLVFDQEFAPVIVGQNNELLLNENEQGDDASNVPKIPSTIHQIVISVPHVVKLPFLVVTLRNQGKDKSVIVFTNSCVRCELVRMTLQLLGFPVCSLNSLLNQKQRLENLALFKTGISKILVATDVAARGLDIPQANLVLHYDFPKLTATYVHRTGRTGRAGAEGTSIALCTESEVYFLQRLENRLGSKVHGLGARNTNTKKQQQGARRPIGSTRNMTIAEHEELLRILDEVSMAKVTGKTHLLDEVGDRISQHKELSASAEYKANRSKKIRHDGRHQDEDQQKQQEQQRPRSQRPQKQQRHEAAAAAATAAPAAAASKAARNQLQQRQKLRRNRE